MIVLLIIICVMVLLIVGIVFPTIYYNSHKTYGNVITKITDKMYRKVILKKFKEIEESVNLKMKEFDDPKYTISINVEDFTAPNSEFGIGCYFRYIIRDDGRHVVFSRNSFTKSPIMIEYYDEGSNTLRTFSDKEKEWFVLHYPTVCKDLFEAKYNYSMDKLANTKLDDEKRFLFASSVKV